MKVRWQLPNHLNQETVDRSLVNRMVIIEDQNEGILNSRQITQ